MVQVKMCNSGPNTLTNRGSPFAYVFEVSRNPFWERLGEHSLRWPYTGFPQGQNNFPGLYFRYPGTRGVRHKIEQWIEMPV